MKIKIGSKEVYIFNKESLTENIHAFFEASRENPNEAVILEDDFGRIIAAANCSKIQKSQDNVDIS